MVSGKSEEAFFPRKLRMGMVGGGRDAFIGAVHRRAAQLDGAVELVAGAFSSTAEKSKASGRDLYVPEERTYGSWEEMVEKESALPEGERIDFVSIVTPNHMHYPVAKDFVEAGFHVACDKPMVNTVEQAEDLVRSVREKDVLFLVTYNYSGYPMVKQARCLVESGELGTIRKVIVEYPQGWLGERIEESGSKQAEWRTDPARSGVAGCMGDIGSHCEQLMHYITGLEVESICADLTTFAPGRPLDDNADMLIRFQGGARGILTTSQISTGQENSLRIRVWGTKGGLGGCRRSRISSTSSTPTGRPEIYKPGNPTSAPRRRPTSACRPGTRGVHRGLCQPVPQFYRLDPGQDPGDRAVGHHVGLSQGGGRARGVHLIHKAVESSNSTEKWIPAAYSI